MELNIEAINELADRIEACSQVAHYAHEPEMGNSFSMMADTYECGAPACLMGHNQELHNRNAANGSTRNMANDLGITRDQAIDLCVPKYQYANYRQDDRGKPGHITTAHAIAVLRNLVNTGEVDWRIGAYQPPLTRVP